MVRPSGLRIGSQVTATVVARGVAARRVVVLSGRPDCRLRRSALGAILNRRLKLVGSTRDGPFQHLPLMHSRQQLAESFRSLGIVPGDVVMVHASVRAVGEVAGGPDVIHLALMDALSDDGTLEMYAGCPRYVDEVGRGNLSPAEEAQVLDKLPPFDPRTARAARDHGILVEFLRTYLAHA